MRREGFDPYFALYVGPDDKNSTMNIVHTYQSGLSLGQKDYYLESDSATTAIREQFRSAQTGELPPGQNWAEVFRFQGYTISYGIAAARFERDWYSRLLCELEEPV